MTLVSLTFDDGLDCHLDAAVPALDRHGLPGTFYLPLASDQFARRHADWKEAARRGHELGNHSIFHPGASTKSWVTEGIRIEDYSLDRMSRELKAANTFLEMLDGRKERTYAFPCSNPWIGGHGWTRQALAWAGLDRTRLAGWTDRFGLDFGASRTDYTEVVAPLFVAARCGGVAAEALPAVPPDRHRVRGVEGDGKSLGQLEAVVAAAKERGAWLVLVFHGIGGGHDLKVDLDAFENLLARLEGDPGVEVVTFLEGAKRLWS